jgi:serine protease Do
MAQETISSPVPSSISSLLPDAFSHALVQIVNRLQPSIVQVRNGGRGAGTGIIWSTDGYIITNHHVVPGDKATIHVHLSDGRVLDARVVDRHPKQDLAMLQVTEDNLQAASAGDSSKLRVGEWVFAIGNPWGQRGVVTAGIVSGFGTARHNDDDEEQPTHYIKSDVHLAPGNSGGPLLDAEGRVVGINAMIFGGDLAVAIPSNVVSSWLEAMPGRRVTLAIELQPVELPADLRQKAGLEAERTSGLLVVASQAAESGGLNGSQQPAATGVFIGDVLLDAAGKPLSDAASLLEIIARHGPQDTVRVRMLRGGNLLTFDVAVETLELK